MPSEILVAKSKIPPNSVGLAGEFAVLSRLILEGYDASMTFGNTKSVDILVYDPRTQKTYQVEVKTNRESRDKPSNSKIFGKFLTDWQMHEKHEKVEAPRLFYCFVHINVRHEKPEFSFFIVPSRVVAKYCREEHKYWLRYDSAHRNSERRLFKLGFEDERYPIETPLFKDYEDNWDFKEKD